MLVSNTTKLTVTRSRLGRVWAMVMHSNQSIQSTYTNKHTFKFKYVSIFVYIFSFYMFNIYFFTFLQHVLGILYPLKSQQEVSYSFSIKTVLNIQTCFLFFSWSDSPYDNGHSTSLGLRNNRFPLFPFPVDVVNGGGPSCRILKGLVIPSWTQTSGKMCALKNNLSTSHHRS